MGVVETECKEKLEACKLFCEIKVAMISDRNRAKADYIRCVREICEKEYQKCLDETPLGQLLMILA